MNVLTVFEQRIGAIFEEGAPGERKPLSFKRLAKRAVREMEDETFVIDGVDTAPALYTILVSSKDDIVMRPLYARINDEISQLVEAQAKKRGYTFVGKPLVRFMVDPALRSGRFSVFAENIDPRTLARLRDEENAYLGIAQPSAAFVEHAPARGEIAREEAFVEEPVVEAPLDIDEPQEEVAEDLAGEDVEVAEDLADEGASAAEDYTPDEQAFGELLDEELEEEEREEPLEDASTSAEYDDEPLEAYEEEAPEVETESAVEAEAEVEVETAAEAEAEAAPEETPSKKAPSNDAAEDMEAQEVQPVIQPAQADEEALAEKPVAYMPAPEAPEVLVDIVSAEVYEDEPREGGAMDELVPTLDETPNAAVAPQEPAPVTSEADQIDAILAAPLPRAASEPSCTLTDLATGKVYTISNDYTPIGRERVVGAIVLTDPNVSRRHAILSHNAGVWSIQDRNSTNGTLVNDIDVRDAVLHNGDVLTIGLTNLEFRAG